MDLLLRGEVLLHLQLRSPQHEGLQYLMELPDHLDVLLLDLLLSLVLLLACRVEPIIEHLAGAEYFWEEEVKQRPQLVQVVLKRRPSQEQFALGVQLPHHNAEL